RARALEDDLHHLLEREQVIRHAVELHRPAGDVLHHDVARFLADAGVVDLRDVRMLQLSRERGLGEEQLAEQPPAHRVAQRLRENALYRDLAIAERVLAQEHLRGGAFAELAHDRIVGDALHAGSPGPRRRKAAGWPWRDDRPGSP